MSFVKSLQRTSLFFLFSIVLFFQNALVKSMPQFLGDISLSEYLVRYFSNTKASNHLFLIDYTSTANQLNNQPNEVYEVSHLHHIHFTYLSFSNLSILEKLFGDKLNIQSIYVIVDCRSGQPLNETQLTTTFTDLSNFYQRCNKCQPLIVLLSNNTSISAITSAVSTLPERFQSVLLNGHTVVHVNAIINGCIRSRGVLVPKTVVHWEQLKMDLHKCDLNGTLLNVSLNHVNVFIIWVDKLYWWVDILLCCYQWPPFCDLQRHKNGSVSLRFSLEGELLKELQRKVNFRAHLIDSENVWGIQNVNGSWNGAIGSVLNEVWKWYKLVFSN